MSVTADEVLAALGVVRVPSGVPLSGVVRGDDIVIGATRLFVSIPIGDADPAAWEPVRAAAQNALAGVAGVGEVFVTLTAERTAAAAKPAPAKPAATKPAPGAAVPKIMPALAQVGAIIAVASGKGGVGKSTTACNLALALAARGLAVGVLDADIYGPSMPKLFALKGQPRIASGRTLVPLEAYGCKVMSIGFVVDADNAMIWRGPMMASAITQMLRDVAWGTLDVLVVDMPPGTGDAQLTLAQQTPLAGAIIVSTPQDLSLIDARRGITMFQNVGVRVLGLVENMSYFICDECGKRHEIFAHGGARAEAARLGVPFLGEIPLEALIRARSDEGLPLVIAAPDHPAARAYHAIAAQVWRSLRPAD